MLRNMIHIGFGYSCVFPLPCGETSFRKIWPKTVMTKWWHPTEIYSEYDCACVVRV